MPVACAPVAIADAPPLDLQDLEPFRRELTGYCYRMLGSAFEAEDAVQEAMVRAWKAADSFEGRSSLKSWVYRIATNVCLDMLRSRQRKARPMDLGPASTVETAQLRVLDDDRWLTPIPDASVDPAEIAESRDTIRLAFVAALQHLPPKQRAVLILCEVLRWQATEVAELLDTTVASVNSALQRARATLAARDVSQTDARNLDPDAEALLTKFVDAFERYDMKALAALLHEDVIMSMPPFDLWIEGPSEMVGWMLGPGSDCEGSRVLATAANGCPAFAQYRIDPDGGWAPWALHVLEVSDGAVVADHAFVERRLFPVFGFPEHLD